MQLTGWETIFFYALGVLALFTGILVISARNPVHSALALISTLISVAGLFLLLHAEFIAGVQVLVYVGGVMVLFLFVIMLVHIGREETDPSRIYTRYATPATIFAVVLAFAFMVAVNYAKPALAPERTARPAAASSRAGISRDTEEVGTDLYRRAALPFEIASVVLLVAIIGSVLLARERKQEKMFD